MSERTLGKPSRRECIAKCGELVTQLVNEGYEPEDILTGLFTAYMCAASTNGVERGLSAHAEFIGEHGALANSPAISEKQLMAVVGCKTRNTLRRRLGEAGVPYIESGTIWTTDSALTEFMMGRRAEKAVGPDWEAMDKLL